jgi:peptide/nickel transport system permease protein
MRNFSTSSQLATWKRLKKNKGAVFSLVVIILAIFSAIFAYYIAPDSSPNANRIILEIGSQKPGFTKIFILIPKENKTINKNSFHHLLYGIEDGYEYIPVNSYRFASKDSITIKKYIDEDVEESVTIPVKKDSSGFAKSNKKLSGWVQISLAEIFSAD